MNLRSIREWVDGRGPSPVLVMTRQQGAKPLGSVEGDPIVDDQCRKRWGGDVCFLSIFLTNEWGRLAVQEKEITYPIMESVLVIFQCSMMKDDEPEDNVITVH